MDSSTPMEEKIVEVAKQVFQENGYEMTSMSDIATRAGINRPTLHYYFRTKERMFQAVAAPILDDFIPQVETIIMSESPFMVKVERLLDAYMLIFKENPSLPRFVVGEMHRDIDNFLHLVGEFRTEPVFRLLLETLQNEMNSGHLKQVPIPVVMGTFYALLTFPFLAGNMLTRLFFDSEEKYNAFLEEWKVNVLSQLRYLLQV